MQCLPFVFDYLFEEAVMGEFETSLKAQIRHFQVVEGGFDVMLEQENLTEIVRLVCCHFYPNKNSYLEYYSSFTTKC